jgi:hypothetical protein
MGGESKTTQTQTSQTNPWLAAQPALKGILGQLNGLIPNSGLSNTSQDAINQLEQNAQAGNPYAGQISNVASNLLNGGGANATAPMVNSAYQTYQQQTNPLASNTNYDPMSTPGLADSLKTLGSDITGQINGQFAAAGRDMSGMNTQTLARGLTQGLAPVLTQQYNQNVANQQGAASNLYNAGNTTSGVLGGLNQAGLANQVQGISTANDALAGQNYTPTQLLNLESLKQQLPAQSLGLLAQIGIPIAGLGSQSSGTATGTQQMSGAQQFGLIAGGLGSLFKSDRRAKEDITQVGQLFDGTPVYRFRYIGSPAFQIGLMAQDVEKYAPAAVEEINGLKHVDYLLATDRAAKKDAA